MTAQGGTESGGIRLRDNPVLRREMIERMRGGKAVVFLLIWLVLLTGILLLAYQGSVTLNDGLDVGAFGRIGRQLFEWVLFGMMMLVLFLVPGLTAGAITGERERETLVPLQMTLMRPRDIIVGKLSAALSFVLLLIVAAMPLLAVSVLVGGVRLFDMARGLGMLIFNAVVLGAIGVWISAQFRRTTAATVFTYAVAAVYAFGSFAAMIAFAIVDASTGGTGEPPAFLLAFSSFAAIADALPPVGNQFFGDTVSPFGGLRSAIAELSDRREFDDNGFAILEGRSWIWHSHVVIGLVILVVSVLRAAKAVATPAETER